MKYVVVTGGVVTASSIGVVLKACAASALRPSRSVAGLAVTESLADPYLNADAGTISPHEHGEVFVLDDGGEVDLDLGNYLGQTVQCQLIPEIIPHYTDAIQDWIERVAMVPVDGQVDPADVCVIELGGTIGDIESMPFVEALSQFSYRVGAGNFCLVLVSLVPVLNVVGEQKTKPTQHSVRDLRTYGLTPDIIACRSTKELEKNAKEKLSRFCHVPVANIFTLHDVSNIWRVPLLLRDQKAHVAILKVLNLESATGVEPNFQEWVARANLFDTLLDTVRIAVVGKYTGLPDTYHSVIKALLHACIACGRKLVIDWVPSTDLEGSTATVAPDSYNTAWSSLRGADGIVVPGGFGDRGVEGKILAAKYARENNVPYLGICLGMQLAIVEFARHVLKLPDANSTEFDANTKTPCVVIMPKCSSADMGGGTMRCGSKRTFFKVADSKSAKLYGSVSHIDERYRHRYQIVEIPDHLFFVGVQFLPEFKSRPSKPSALFVGLIAASSGQLDRVLKNAANHKLSNFSLAPMPQQIRHAKKHNSDQGNGHNNGNDVQT